MRPDRVQTTRRTIGSRIVQGIRSHAMLFSALAFAALSFFAGYYTGRPSLDELNGLPTNMRPVPDRLLGVWVERGSGGSAQITFFRDWSYWYHTKPVMARRIMGSFSGRPEGTSVILRPSFFTRTSVDDVSPGSAEIAGKGSAAVLKTPDGKTFVKLHN